MDFRETLYYGIAQREFIIQHQILEDNDSSNAEELEVGDKNSNVYGIL